MQLQVRLVVISTGAVAHGKEINKPILRQHHQDTYKKSREPEAVGNDVVVHVTVQEEAEEKAYEDERTSGHVIIKVLVAVLIHVEHAVQQVDD